APVLRHLDCFLECLPVPEAKSNADHGLEMAHIDVVAMVGEKPGMALDELPEVSFPGQLLLGCPFSCCHIGLDAFQKVMVEAAHEQNAAPLLDFAGEGHLVLKDGDRPANSVLGKDKLIAASRIGPLVERNVHDGI